MKQRLYFSLVLLTAFAAPKAFADTPGSALGPLSMDSYTQVLTVTFKSEEAARKATIDIAPLYHDFQAAFSTRMDDSNVNDLMAAEVMAKYGQKGTFYLNNPNSWYQISTETGITIPDKPGQVIPKSLLVGGNSLGGHTLSHEYLPVLSKNAAFREILGTRVAVETAGSTPVNAFVYPFVSFISNLRGGSDRADLEEILRRSGYVQLGENEYNRNWDSGLQDAHFIILDGDTQSDLWTFDGHLHSSGANKHELTRAQCNDDRPLLLVTMHAWVRAWGAPDFPKLAAVYAKWSGHKDWWYCNQNQYGAYRYQALHSRMATFVEGNSLRVVLRRPSPLDLNDWVPLTLKVDGVGRGDTVSVVCSGADVKPMELGGAYAFDLFHGRDQGPIDTYAESDNPENSDRIEGSTKAMEGLRAVLHQVDGKITLILRNDGLQTLRNIRVVFRLPLRWQEGVIRRQVESLEAGASVSLGIFPTERSDAVHYRDGREFDVAQVDFVGAHRARLYAVCETADVEPEAFYSRNGFWMLGPLAGDMAGFNPETFARPFIEGSAPKSSYTVPWVKSISWRTLQPFKAAILDPDIIPTSGKANTPKNYRYDPSVYFSHAKAHYLLYGRIVSPQNRTVRVILDRESVKRLSVNGGIVEGDELNLRKGGNDIRVLYAPRQGIGSTFDQSNYGCYFRLVDSAGARVEDVRFERPPLP